MKKLFSLIIVAVMILLTTACGSNKTIEAIGDPVELKTNSVIEIDETKDNLNISVDDAKVYYAPTLDTLKINEISVDETVLVDDNGIKITAVGVELDEESNVCVQLKIENNTDNDVTVYASSGSVNGCDIIPSIYGGLLDIGAHEEIETLLGYLRYDLQIHGITDINYMEVSFRISDTDGNFLDNCWYTTSVRMNTIENIVTNENCDIGPAIVYDNNGVTISILGIYNNEDTGCSDVAIYIENYNTYGISVESSYIEANGCESCSEFNRYIKPEDTKLEFIEIDKEFFSKNGFKTVDDIKTTFNIVEVYDTGYEPLGDTGEILVKF